MVELFYLKSESSAIQEADRIRKRFV